MGERKGWKRREGKAKRVCGEKLVGKGRKVGWIGGGVGEEKEEGKGKKKARSVKVEFLGF